MTGLGQRQRKGRPVHGYVVIDKPADVSSNHILQRVKRLFNARKAGHTGTLDPLATGLLPICLGEATKFAQYGLDAGKGYETTAHFGVRTDTSDATGQVLVASNRCPRLNELEAALAQFRGHINQTPSMFSALKYQGKPLYEYARAGKTVAREPRAITVSEFQLLSFSPPLARFRISCSKGTYIRTLIDDLGEVLQTGAHVTALRRISVNGFNDLHMWSLAELEALAESNRLEQALLPVDHLLYSLPSVAVDQQRLSLLQHGQFLYLDETDNPASIDIEKGPIRLMVDEQFWGLVEMHIDKHGRPCLKPKRLLQFD